MSKRRTRTPRQTAFSDQANALARDLAADLSTLPIVLDPPNGEQCTWCDCPDGPNSPHNRSGYRCGGCPAAADHVVRVFSSPNRRVDYPACDRHHVEIIAAIATVAATVRKGGRP